MAKPKRTVLPVPTEPAVLVEPTVFEAAQEIVRKVEKANWHIAKGRSGKLVKTVSNLHEAMRIDTFVREGRLHLDIDAKLQRFDVIENITRDGKYRGFPTMIFVRPIEKKPRR